MTHSYRWQHLRFDVPAGVDDDTLVTFREAGSRPAFNVTLATSPLSSSTVAAYAQQQEAALRARRVPGYAAEAHRTVDVAGRSAVVCDRRFTDDGGAKFVQRQVFIGVGKDVTMVTATSEESAGTRAYRALESILSTLRLDDDLGGTR